MANPNILNSTSVKYHSLDVIIDKQLFTLSSLTSDYQTKNIVSRNNTNSGKVFKITRIAIGNQQVSNFSPIVASELLPLTYITDYTDSSIGDTAYYSSTAAPLYGEFFRITFIREQDITSSKDINTVSVLPSTSSTSLFQNSDQFYLKEGCT